MMNEIDYPALYRAADRASINAQKRHMLLVRIYLGLLIGAAGFSVYGIEGKPYAIISAILIIGSLFCSVFMLLRPDEDVWYQARAVAESVKTSCWRFMMRANPYGDATDVNVVKQEFHDNLMGILNEHRDLMHLLGGSISEEEQITEKMCEIRDIDWRERINFYKKYRIDEQRSWYAEKSSWNSRQRRKWFGFLITCQVFAVLIVVFRVACPTWGVWPLELFLVMAGSILTWIQAKRFRELAAAYTLTAYEIGIVQSKLREIASEDLFVTFVSDSEDVFSREHTQWLARRNSI